MAGISTKDLKARIRSMESTRQITKAMEMVAASKLRGAQEKAISSRPYFEVLYSTMLDLADSRPEHLSPFCKSKEDVTNRHFVLNGLLYCLTKQDAYLHVPYHHCTIPIYLCENHKQFLHE